MAIFRRNLLLSISFLFMLNISNIYLDCNIEKREEIAHIIIFFILLKYVVNVETQNATATMVTVDI